MEVSRERWLKALNELDDPEEPGALTMKELQIVFGSEEHPLGTTRTKHRIKRLVAAGRCRVTTKRIVGMTGRYVVVPAYVLLSAPRHHGDAA
jgi:hypothetical protein